MKPTEHNEMENKALKEPWPLLPCRCSPRAPTTENLAGTTCRFGYLFQIDGHGLEALFQLVTDKGDVRLRRPGRPAPCGSRSMRRSLKA